MTQRTILFRGKSVKNGQWVEGDLIQSNDQYNHKTLIWPINTSTTDNMVGVDPATVGQFTGLTDKNGVNIFEGDIINCIDHDGTLRREIVFNKLDYFAFGWSTQSVSTHIGIGWKMEVIGNIHENPELL